MRHGTINSGSLLTVADVRNAISVGGNLSYNSSTGVISYNMPSFVMSVAGKTGAVTISSADITDATDASTASKIVKRDASGNFAAGTITASLSGNATSATTSTSASKLSTARTITHSGDVTGSASFDGSADVSVPLTLASTAVTAGSYGSSTSVGTFTVDGKGRLTAAASSAIAFPVTAVAGRTGAIVLASADITDATDANTASKIVARDASGNFSAGTISAALNGNAASATKLATARTITLTGAVAGSANFDGSSNVTINTISNLRTYTLYADQLDNPSSADWSVNALAPATNDPTNSAFVVRAFDDTAEEGVGFMLAIPANAVNLSLTLKGRPNTAPSTAQGVVMRLHRRTLPNNAAVSAWTITTLTTLSVTANIYYQYFTQTFTLAALGITAGTTVHFELTRQGSATADTLSGDFLLLEASVDFS